MNATAAEISLLDEALAELLDEEGALERWAENGDPAIGSVLNAMLADPDDMPGYGQHLDDLSASYASAIDLSGFEQASAAIELAREQREKDIRMTRWTGLARGILHGDLHGMCEAYARAGSAGHKAVELAQEYGGYGRYDTNDSIELARFTGQAPDICGQSDRYGRCMSRYHDVGCSHTVEASAAYGVRPEDSAAWQRALARRAGQPAADEHGKITYDQFGNPVTMTGFIEASAGERLTRETRFYEGADRGELVSPQRRQVVGDPDADNPVGTPIPYSSRATAARMIQQNPSWQSRRESAVGRAFTAQEQAAYSLRMQHPDFRWPILQAQREARMSQRPALQFSQPMTAADGEDITSAVCGSLGPGIGG